MINKKKIIINRNIAEKAIARLKNSGGIQELIDNDSNDILSRINYISMEGKHNEAKNTYIKYKINNLEKEYKCQFYYSFIIKSTDAIFIYKKKNNDKNI